MKPRQHFTPSIVLSVCLWSCFPYIRDSDVPVLAFDKDGDHYNDELMGGDDCNDSDSDVHPNAEELPGQGDRDCNGQIWCYEMVDRDSDGWLGGDLVEVDGDECDESEGFFLEFDDCDDDDPDVFPGRSRKISDESTPTQNCSFELAVVSVIRPSAEYLDDDHLYDLDSAPDDMDGAERGGRFGESLEYGTAVLNEEETAMETLIVGTPRAPGDEGRWSYLQTIAAPTLTSGSQVRGSYTKSSGSIGRAAKLHASTNDHFAFLYDEDMEVIVIESTDTDFATQICVNTFASEHSILGRTMIMIEDSYLLAGVGDSGSQTPTMVAGWEMGELEGLAGAAPGDGSCDSSATFAIVLEEAEESFGISVATGNSAPDEPTVFIGSPTHNRVYMIRPSDYDSEGLLYPNNFLSIEGAHPDDKFGTNIVACDLNGDNIDEILVGAPYAGSDSLGRVYVFDLSQEELSAPGASPKNLLLEPLFQIDLDTDVMTEDPDFSKAHIGYVQCNGDFDGDGLSDLVLSTPNATQFGEDDPMGIVALFYAADLPTSTPGAERNLTFADANDYIRGHAHGDKLGNAVVFLPDPNGSEYDLLAIGAPGKSVDNLPQEDGAVYIFQHPDAPSSSD